MLKRYIPLLEWRKTYNRHTFNSDLIAAMIVTVMLIPQSLAYALLAGLPAEVGLYASILPLIAYSIFGTSSTLSVGPVAVVSLMTAAAISSLGMLSMEQKIAAAMALAFISGLLLLVMGLFRLCMLANFLSHPVISGFISAAGLVIAASQLPHLMGISAHGHNLFELGQSIYAQFAMINYPTLIIGVSTLALLWWVRKSLKPLLLNLNIPDTLAGNIAKTGPVLAIILTILVTWGFNLDARGVAVVGDIPQGLPDFSVPVFNSELWQQLFSSAVLISIIGFVESVSVAQTLAAKRRQRISPDQELIGLGAANIASSVSGGFPVTGGFSRSVVNFDAGAKSPAAGAYAAMGIALATVFLTPLIYFLPKATLAATIIIAVLSLVDFQALKRTWQYSRGDFAAMSVTIIFTLISGVELGILLGVGLSILLYLYRTSRPHSALVGLLEGTEHFRNIDRHQVKTCSKMLTLRIDESLYFANARYLEDRVYDLVAQHPKIEHFVLMCPAVNYIDASALESLEAINTRLGDSGVLFHLSEVKGPVMDKLTASHFNQQLTGEVFLSQYDAWQALSNKKPTPS